MNNTFSAEELANLVGMVDTQLGAIAYRYVQPQMVDGTRDGRGEAFGS
jgi:hypothetical protein